MAKTWCCGHRSVLSESSKLWFSSTSRALDISTIGASFVGPSQIRKNRQRLSDQRSIHRDTIKRVLSAKRCFWYTKHCKVIVMRQRVAMVVQYVTSPVRIEEDLRPKTLSNTCDEYVHLYSGPILLLLVQVNRQEAL